MMPSVCILLVKNCLSTFYTSDADPLVLCLGAGQFGTDESTFNSILATRSWPYLRQLMVDYQAITGKTLESAVKAEFSANAEKGLLAIRKFHSPQLAKELFVFIGLLFHSAMR